MSFVRTVLLLGALACALPAQAGDVALFYLSAPDCRYCRAWEANSRQALLASPEGRAIRFIEIRGETLREPILARHYPAEHRWAFEQIGASRGVPRFVLFSNGRIVASAYGLSAYENSFLPALRAAVAGGASSACSPVQRRES